MRRRDLMGYAVTGLLVMMAPASVHADLFDTARQAIRTDIGRADSSGVTVRGGASINSGVSPSSTTLLRGQAEQQWGDPERWPELTKHMPFGRAAEPDEVADLAVFLASDRASYVSGVVMTLDGGQAARH